MWMFLSVLFCICMIQEKERSIISYLYFKFETMPCNKNKVKDDYSCDVKIRIVIENQV